MATRLGGITSVPFTAYTFLFPLGTLPPTFGLDNELPVLYSTNTDYNYHDSQDGLLDYQRRCYQRKYQVRHPSSSVSASH